MTSRSSSFVYAAAVLSAVACLLVSCGKKDEAKVSADDTATYTYSFAITPVQTWNPTDMSMANESKIFGYTSSGLYEYALNDTKDGYKAVCEMAEAFPEDVTAEYAGKSPYHVPAGADSGYAWKIKLRKDPCWDNGTPIDAATYEYSLKQFLNPQMKNYRSGNFYEERLIIANAEAYYEGEGNWDDVGFIKDDSYTMTFVLDQPLTPFMFVYNIGLLSPLREDLYEGNKQQSGDIVKSSYNTSVESSASCGPYKVTAYQPEKSMMLSRNEKWYGYSDGRHKDEYQTTNIYIQFISEPATQLSLFLQGKLSEVSLTVNDLPKYAASEYRVINPLSYTWKFSFNSDKESLKREDSAGINHSFIANKDFRHAVSLALDRHKYVETIDIGSTPGFGLVNYSYVADPETNSLYRDTAQAQEALCEFYGTSNIDDITGYDLANAREYMDKAYRALLADGSIKDTDRFQIDLHMAVASPGNVRRTAFLQEAIDGAAEGTGFEGKVKVTLVTDQDYYNNMKKGNVDAAITGWGGASFDPYGILWCYCTKEALSEYGFDPETETCTITINGRELTKTYTGWYNALCNGEYVTADIATRCAVLAGVEKALLGTYIMLPVSYWNSNVLVSQRVIEGADIYINDLVERGGIQARHYTMNDEEWEAYCAENNYQLKY